MSHRRAGTGPSPRARRESAERIGRDAVTRPAGDPRRRRGRDGANVGRKLQNMKWLGGVESRRVLFVAYHFPPMRRSAGRDPPKWPATSRNLAGTFTWSP